MQKVFYLDALGRVGSVFGVKQSCKLFTGDLS